MFCISLLVIVEIVLFFLGPGKTHIRGRKVANFTRQCLVETLSNYENQINISWLMLLEGIVYCQILELVKIGTY